MNKIKRFYSSFILLFIGGLMAKTQFHFTDGCKGMGEGILFAFLFFIYALTFFIILTLSLIKYIEKKEPFNYFPLLTTLLVGVIIYVSFHQEIFESEIILDASSNDHHCLILRKNNKFMAQVREVDWSCYHKGDYLINQDTLILLRKDIEVVTDRIFNSKYLIDTHRKYLFPLGGSEIIQDTNRWMKIKENRNCP